MKIMNIMNFLLLLILIIVKTESIKLNQVNHNSKCQKVLANQNINQALKFYRKDAQIQQQIDKIVIQDPQTFKKIQCRNDQKYKYLIIDYRNLTKKQNINKKKRQIVITCNVHARQLLVSQVCLDFIKNLSTRLSFIQANSKDTIENQKTKNIFESIRLTIFYRGNAERDKVMIEKSYCIRKDQNSIDINRNFPTNYNIFNRSQQSQQYPGDYPLSQPFSQCLDNFLKDINQTGKFDTFIDIHTGQFTLYDSFATEDKKLITTVQLLNLVKIKYCPQCKIKSLGGQKDDQITDGEIFTDVKKRYRIQHSVLLEIYGAYNQNYSQTQNCFVIFNPLTQSQLNYYKQKWVNALFYLINLTSK